MMSALKSTQTTIDPQVLEFFVRQSAKSIHHAIELKKLSAELNRISDKESTSEDWYVACAFLALLLIEREQLRFEQLDPISYRLLEEVWFEDIKQLKAYYIWESQDKGSAEDNYFSASGEIHNLMLQRKRAPIHAFSRVSDYISSNYLTRSGGLDETKPATNALLQKKAHRIWQLTGCKDDRANWFRARAYVSMFYENVIRAVNDNDQQKWHEVLKALQFEKRSQNQYQIINGFETLIAIDFVSEDIIAEIKRSPHAYSFSMEPVDNWQSINIPDICSHKIQFAVEEKELRAEGMISTEERDALLQVVNKPEHKIAVERLYIKSQLPSADALL
jgi:hypothetical protein